MKKNVGPVSEKKMQGYNLVSNFEGFWPVIKLKSKHIDWKDFPRATECIL